MLERTNPQHRYQPPNRTPIRGLCHATTDRTIGDNMPPRRATREAGPATVTPIDELTTAADIEEALGHLVTAARTAAERHNTIVYAITHRRIDDHLETWQVLHALEAH